MCTAEQSCPLLAWDELAALTRAMVGRRVEVSLLVGPGDGKTVGRVVRYAALAPACTVPHELAHVELWPNVDHDQAWQAAYRRLHQQAVNAWAGLATG